MADDAVLWAYGVVPAGQPAPGPSVGLDGRAVVSVRHGDLAVLATAVPAGEFGGAELERRLEDLPELGRLARAHDAVLEAALSAGEVIPFRLCTLFATRQAVEDMLAAERERFGAALARLRGTAEWGVKAFAASAAPSAGPEQPPASGTEYLLRRRRERAAAEASRDATVDTASAVHAALAERSVRASVSRPQDRRLSGREAEMVLNGAYLVRRADAGAFAALVAELGRRHADVELELTGPWPPYHFAAEASA
jgi:hypothetical protein